MAEQYFIMSPVPCQVRGALFLDKMHVHVRVAHRHAVARKALAHLFVEREVHVPVIGVLHPHAYHVFHDAVLVFVQRHEGGGVLEDAAVGADDLHDRALDLLGGLAVRGAEEHVHAAQGIGAVIVDRRADHVAVGDGDHDVVKRVDRRVEQTDAADDAGLAGDLDEVALGEGMGHQEGQSGEEIAQQALYGQRQRQACHAQQRDQRGRGDAQLARDDDHGDDPQRDLYGGEQEVLHGPAHFLRAAQRAGDDLKDDADDDEADEEGDERAEERAQRHRADVDVFEAVEKWHRIPSVSKSVAVTVYQHTTARPVQTRENANPGSKRLRFRLLALFGAFLRVFLDLSALCGYNNVV